MSPESFSTHSVFGFCALAATPDGSTIFGSEIEPGVDEMSLPSHAACTTVVRHEARSAPMDTMITAAAPTRVTRRTAALPFPTEQTV